MNYKFTDQCNNAILVAPMRNVKYPDDPENPDEFVESEFAFSLELDGQRVFEGYKISVKGVVDGLVTVEGHVIIIHHKVVGTNDSKVYPLTVTATIDGGVEIETVVTIIIEKIADTSGVHIYPHLKGDGTILKLKVTTPDEPTDGYTITAVPNFITRIVGNDEIAEGSRLDDDNRPAYLMCSVSPPNS